jgi:hypothetical protein
VRRRRNRRCRDSPKERPYSKFLAEPSKGDVDVNPISGKTICDMISDLYKTPTNIVKETGRAIGAQ